MSIKYIKVEDLKHVEYPYGIEIIDVDDNDEYSDTIDVFWFKTENERNIEYKDLILE